MISVGGIEYSRQNRPIYDYLVRTPFSILASIIYPKINANYVLQMSNNCLLATDNPKLHFHLCAAK